MEGEEKKKNSVHVTCLPEEQGQERAKVLELAAHQPLQKQEPSWPQRVLLKCGILNWVFSDSLDI